MRRFAALTLVCLTAVVMFASSGAARGQAAAAEEMVENPQYQSWARHKPGTNVVMQMTTVAQGQNMNMEITQTLKDVKPDQLTVEVVNKMDMMGQKHEMPAQTVTVMAKVPKSEADVNKLPAGVKGTAKEAANETVTVAGKTYDCKVTEFSGEAQGTKSKGKVWRHDDVPGMVLKTEMNFEGAQTGNMTMQVVAVNPK
jgi:hypothetical protein